MNKSQISKPQDGLGIRSLVMRTPDDRDPNSDNQISGARENESPPL